MPQRLINHTMKVATLTKETNEIQRVVTLKNNRNHRHHYQEFVIEGHAAIDEAYRMNWEIRAIFFNKDRPLSQWAKGHLDRHQYEIAYATSSYLMDKISDKTESSELIAIVKTKTRHLQSYQPQQKDVIIVLDEPKSPGNIGMIIRSATAFGASALVISGHAADEYDPKCIRSSVGTFFTLPIYRVEGIASFSTFIDQLKLKSNTQIIASGNHGTVSLENVHFTQDILFFILGNETSGISRGYQQIADEFVQIPLSGKFTSLNIGAAASIFLYAIFQQRKSF